MDSQAHAYVLAQLAQQLPVQSFECFRSADLPLQVCTQQAYLVSLAFFQRCLQAAHVIALSRDSQLCLLNGLAFDIFHVDHCTAFTSGKSPRARRMPAATRSLVMGVLPEVTDRGDQCGGHLVGLVIRRHASEISDLSS